ncbi:Uncharacterized protein (Fragment), partial [Durusdinium trenchii]
VWGWCGDAMRWADMVDSDEDLAADPAAAPVGLVAPSPVRCAVAFPFHVVLRAYICGLVDARVSRSAMGSLQQLLRGDPRTSPWLCGSYYHDLVFGIELAAEAKLRRACAYLLASQCCLLSPAALQLWWHLLEVECCVDFPCLTLWMVLFPGRAPPAVAHLGVLARGHAVAAPELRAKHVVQVLRDLFHFACTEQVVASVYEKVLREAPELLGGAPLQLHGVVPEATLIQPVTTRCVDCGCALDVQPAHVALAFLLHMGWKEVAWRRATCRSCHAWYSNVWCSRPGARASCFCVAAPEDVDFLQIVACPRKNGKAFIEVRALWLMRAALLRVRAPFSGFVEMLADLHALPADRKHDCLRFEQHWLLLEALTLLWHRAPHVLRSVAWPLDGQHQTQAWQGILERILPLLSGLVRDIHFREHVCHLCAVPAVTLDAKYGMTCSLCNHREGRVVEYPAINCSVMFGCQRGPAPGHLRYCRMHAADGALAAAADQHILRHRDVDGVRSYKVVGSSEWCLGSALSTAAIQAYEQRLAEQHDRRKRRRRVAASSAHLPAEPEVPGDAAFHDAVEPELRSQADDVNPCGIDKVVLLPRRSYGGLLVATLPCGRVCSAVPLAHAESLTQVYALLSSLTPEDGDARPPLQYVIYDNACALARFARHPLRKERTPTAAALAALTYVLDGFHAQNHTSCLDESHPLYTPEVQRAQHAALQGLNTQTEVDEFFQKLEAEAVFPAGALEQLAPPELVSLWKDIAATQTVAWPWVMLCELALASFLTPNARLHPLASFTVFSLTWSFFLHPGSCHTSNLLRLYQNVFHGLEKKVNRFRAAECARLRQAAQPGADAQALLKERLSKLQPLALRLGTGSLEGIGLRMSQFPDWTAASGFLVEGLQFVQWLQAEFGLNRAIATQLWERMSWQRDVVNQGRSFDMTFPFLAVCGALHLEDVWPMFAQPDPLGLRGRLCFFYTRPALKRARGIEDANQRLRNHRGSNNLEQSLVDRFWRIYQAHAQEHRSAAAFSWHLEYPFLNYSFSDEDEAAATFARAFDAHVQLQAGKREETFLVQHELSKRHGKLKGKHLRHALNWHNVLCSFLQRDPQAWPTTVSVSALRAAELLGAERREKDAVRTHGDQIVAMRRMDAEDFINAVPPAHRSKLLPFAAILLQMHTVWLDSTALRSHYFVRDSFPGASAESKLQFVWRAVMLLERLSVGLCGLTTNPYGPKRLLAVKRPVPTEDGLARRTFLDVLRVLGVDLAAHHGLGLAETLAQRPANAPLLEDTAPDLAAASSLLSSVAAWAAPVE